MLFYLENVLVIARENDCMTHQWLTFGLKCIALGQLREEQDYEADIKERQMKRAQTWGSQVKIKQSENLIRLLKTHLKQIFNHLSH